MVDYEEGMTGSFDAGLNKGLAEGEAKGEARGLAKTARNMKKKGLDLVLISEMTGLSVAEIERL